MSNNNLDKRGDASPTPFERKVVKQIEYYFGDKNLPRDKFLLQQIEEDDGWVTLECMLKFNRFKTLVEDAIGDSLRKFGSGLLEVDESNTKLRRVKPMPEESQEAFMLAKEKTIYCRGFPENTTLDSIEAFFEDKGKCIFIKMRRRIDEGKTFKGSIFVEFSTKEEAGAFLAMKDLKFGDNELIYMSKEAYFKSKKGKKGDDSAGRSVTVKKEESAEDKKESKDTKYEKGRVIHLSGAGDQTSREDIKDVFDLEGFAISWVDFNRGDKEGCVRFSRAGDGEKAITAVKEANDNKVTLRGVETTLRVLEGDEEKEYWEKANQSKENFRKKGGRKFGRRNSQKRKFEQEGTPQKKETSDEPPVKQIKSEET